jgi:2-methylisocitrate lyase-like PEP mutase family enzyme
MPAASPNVPDRPPMPRPLERATGRNRRLRGLLSSPSLLMAPGVFDCLTARLAERAGFDALYMTGSGVSISRMGAPDVALLSFGEILDQARRIADISELPVIADADTGYGGPLNVIRTVRELERAGISGIQIEDQDWPKRCGHEIGRRLVSAREMCARVHAATDARVDPDLVIVARTDARTTLGIEAAIERASLYVEAGADVAFVESPEGPDEMRRIAASIAAPVLANLVEGGRTPMMTAAELEAIGYRVAIYPNSITRLIGRMGAQLYASLRSQGDTRAFTDRMLDHRALWDLFDYPEFVALEGRYASSDEPAPPGRAAGGPDRR